MDGDRRITRSGGIRASKNKFPQRDRVRMQIALLNQRRKPIRLQTWEERKMPRPGWYEDDEVDTVLSVLEEKTESREGKHGTKYQCPACEGFFYRKRVLLNVYGNVPEGKTFITIDHTAPGGYRDIILKNAEPDEDGSISMESAKAAYNNPAFLDPLCGKCNSVKNAKKNMY